MHKKKTIYIIRHGETEWNMTKRMQGQQDIPLNERGRAQAAAIEKHLHGITFDAIYSSPLSRTLETAQIIAQNQKNNHIITHPLLIERGFGDNEGKTHDEFNALHPAFLWTESWKYPDVRSPKGESLQEVHARAAAFIKIIEESSHTSIAIVSHAVVMQLMIGILLEVPMMYCGKFEMKNASLTVIEYTPHNPSILHVSSYVPTEYA